IEAAQIEKDLAVLEKQQLLQSLTLQGIQGYYLTAFSRKSIRIKEEQLHNFKQMLEQTMLRKQAGSATNFDYLNTNAGLQAVKSELIALGAEKEKQYINLGMLADTTISDNTPLSLYFIRKQEKRSLEELITFALENRMEMKIMRKNIELAHLQKKTADRSFNPTLSAGISGGFNNGYEPNINKLRANFAVGATLEVPLYEGGKRKQNIGLANAQINKSTATLTLTEKEITRQVADSYFTLVSAAASLEQLKVQDLVSQEAYQQARTNYQAGTLTNLELVTSATNATNARLLLLQEEINYQIAWYGLLVNLGILIYNTDGN
ncbi:MAG: TolC family protein, partial [Bacteroidales bacterium]